MHAIGRPLLPPGPTSPMAYRDLRDFIAQLETTGELKRVRARRRSAARDDGALRPRAARAAARRCCSRVPRRLRGAERRDDSRARQSVRHAASASRWRWAPTRRTGALLRDVGRLLAFLKEPEPPKSLVDAWRNTRPVLMKALDMAPKERSTGAVPGRRVGRRRRRSRAAAGPDVLARRCGPADHLGTDRHARPAQDAAEPRHLPPAGDRAQQGDHALARASRRRARFPRSRAGVTAARRFRSPWRSAPIRRRSSAR